MPVSHLTAFTAEALKLYPTFSCLVSISYFDTQQNPKGKWNNNPAACKLMKPFWENQSRRKLDMLVWSWFYARFTKQYLKTCWIFFLPLEESPSRPYSSFSDCNFKIWWSRSLHVFKRHYCFSPSPLKKNLQMLGELMTVKDTIFFVSILNLQIIKGRIVVVFERKEGEDFTWLCRRWLREVVLWRGKAAQSRHIPLAFLSGRGEILGLSSGNPCWLWEMPLCLAALLAPSWFPGSCGSMLGLWQPGEEPGGTCLGTITLNTSPDSTEPHLRPGMPLLRSEQIPSSRGPR